MKNRFYPLLILLLFTSCSSAYYNFWETFGKEKRDILESKIEDVHSQQKEVKEEFADALDRVRKTYKFKGGELEKVYDELQSQYNESSEEAKELSERIKEAKDVADDLFSEWKKEAQQISNSKYRRDSLSKLRQTQQQFEQMYQQMQKNEKQMENVLGKFQDQVLYLKHNLNAMSLETFKSEFGDIEKDISSLISDIDQSMARAEKFIKNIK